MFNKRLLLFIFLVILLRNGFAQTPCTALGQNPGTAFPVCGIDTFSIASVPICGDRQVPGPCTAVPLTDKNPYWYKFTCFTAGTLGFLITPNTITDDYDWQIFDITNHNPDDVYTNASLFVACNWSGDGGLTGASSLGTSLSRCDGTGVPRFSSMPTLIQGHEYILLVSHFSNSQSGYYLSFGGGTANITDPVNPILKQARAACDGTSISVKLNKKMKCSSLAANGSDFSISPAIAPIISATGIGCSAGFDMDSVVIKLGGILPPGNYTIRIETGTDGNNLLDNCNRSIPSGQSLPVTVFPLIPTPMDSLSKTGCAPDVLNLVFKDPIFCNSIAADGSDFVVTGTSAVAVSGASGICNAAGFTSIIQVRLSAPIHRAGAFQVRLQTGSDGNTVINECGVQTVAGSFKSFTTTDTVSALFSSAIRFGCIADTVNYVHDGRNGVNSWKWSFEHTISSGAMDTSITYRTFGTKSATLIVSNGNCSDTSTSTVLLNNNVTASFLSTAVVCPGDPAAFTDTSTGPVISWAWNFGNGNQSTLQAPPPQFFLSTNVIRDVPVQLIVKNDIGCADTATNTIRVVGNCYIAIPKGFSPNNDGLNDFLYPTNAYKARDLIFRVYNRVGQLLFQTKDWTNKWNGTFKGNPQDPGTYVWILNYTNIDTGKRFELKGSTVLIR
ncbi:MAG: gliding motility-associated C-terminal domain-containing protein [Ferruginibacter sp.]|nr:gliding motility-associated C-terminal domain-containing protein [Ferruginibacter sp.]